MLDQRKLKIYLGYDTRESIAYEVARFSILRRAKYPKCVQIFPLKLDELSMLNRPIEMRGEQMWCPISDAPMSTQFSNSRFCIPFLTDSWALFADDDIVCLADIADLFALADDRYAVMVVKHKHEPVEERFPDGRIQTVYPRKNWSSIVLWNCDHPANKRFTVDNLNTWPGRDMHAFKWLRDEEIGELPKEWNYLVDVNEKNIEPKIAHYTLGGPWLRDWIPSSSDKIWNDEYAWMRT